MNSLVQTLTDRQKKIEKYWSPLVVDQGLETAAAVINENKYGRVSSEDEKRVCSRETRFQREHIFMNINCPTRE